MAEIKKSNKKNIWVVIPAYNESKNISNVLKKAKRYAQNIVVVDDSSKDNTYNLAKKEGVIVLSHIVNLGKGAALKTGCDFAIKKGAKILVAMDADAQHDPNEIPNFLNALKGNDVVLGYRRFHKKMPLIFRFGNLFISKTTKFLYGLNLRDTQCGYRSFTSDAYTKMRWDALDYSMESEMIANIGKYKFRYTEIPVPTIYSEKHKGTTFLDGIKIVINMIFWRLSR